MDQITDLIAKKIPDRPTLPRSIMSLMQLVGVRFDMQGNAIGLDKIPPEVFVAVEREYLAGIALYARQKSGEVSKTDVDEVLDWMRENYVRFERGRYGPTV